MTREGLIDEIIVTLKEDYDESTLGRRFVGRWLDSQRALFIKNEINKGRAIEQAIIQTIEGLALGTASESMIKAMPVKGTLLRTLLRIPKPMEFNHVSGIVSVRAPEITGYEISMVEREALDYTGSGRFNRSDIFGTYYDGYLWFRVPDHNFRAPLLTTVALDMVCEDPTQVSDYYCNNESCYIQDVEQYPINEALWEYIIASIISNRFKVYSAIVKKDVNDEDESQ